MTRTVAEHEHVPLAKVPHRATTVDAGYKPQLDGLRTFAVAAVFVEHFCPSVGRFQNWGHHGVLLFFVLSGYLITGILLRCRRLTEQGQNLLLTTRQFYARRFLRIFPPYYLLLLILTLYGYSSVRESLWWHLTYTTNIWCTWKGVFPGIVGHFWSLSVEEQFYCCWPWIIICLPERLLMPAILSTLVIAPLSRAITTALGFELGGTLPTSCMDSLGMGALLAYLEHLKADDALSRYFSIRYIIPLIAVAVTLGFMEQIPQAFILASAAMDLVTSWLFACLVIGAARGFASVGKTILQNRAVVYLGRISYGLYLYHIPVLYQVRGRWHRYSPGTELPEPAIFLICTVITVAVAIISWHVFEKPINSWKKFFSYRFARR